MTEADADADADEERLGILADAAADEDALMEAELDSVAWDADGTVVPETLCDFVMVSVRVCVQVR